MNHGSVVRLPLPPKYPNSRFHVVLYETNLISRTGSDVDCIMPIVSSKYDFLKKIYVRSSMVLKEFPLSWTGITKWQLSYCPIIFRLLLTNAFGFCHYTLVIEWRMCFSFMTFVADHWCWSGASGDLDAQGAEVPLYIGHIHHSQRVQTCRNHEGQFTRIVHACFWPILHAYWLRSSFCGWPFSGWPDCGKPRRTSARCGGWFEFMR